ncbi:ATP-binding protein [Bellilinea sp.]
MDNTLITQIFNLLTQPPGNLIYHLILLFSILTGLQTTAIIRTGKNSGVARRLIGGFLILLLGQMVLFLISALVWQKLISNPAILLPLDKAITLLSLAVVSWMWNFSKALQKADAALIALFLFTAILFFVDLSLQVNPLINIPFQWIWTLPNLLIAGLSLVFLFVRKQKFWEIGASFFLIVLAGSVASLSNLQNENEFSATMRLALMCAFPLLPSLAKTLLPAHMPIQEQQEVKAEPQSPRSIPTDSRIIMPWLHLTNARTSSEIITLLTTAIGKTFSSDLTFLVRQENPYRPILLEAGYDLIRDEPLSPIQIEGELCPLITSSLQKGKPLKLIAESESPVQDLLSLTKAVGLALPGHVLMSPIPDSTNGKRAILLFTPYSKREWTVEEQVLLNTIAEELSGLFLQFTQKENLESSVQALQEQLRLNQEQIKALKQELAEARVPAVETPGSLPSISDPALEIAGLLAIQREAQETIQRLENENRTLRDALRDLKGKPASSTEVEHLEKELRQALEEVARLQNALANANMRIVEMQSSAGQSTNLNIKDTEAILSIIQELRQPVSSVIGYTDLLINESTGSLSAQQRKFLERIRSSSDRMQSLLDDLLQTSVFNISPIDLAPQPLDVETLLDHAITDMSDLLREKEINLLMELPPDLPTFYADRDALHQVLIHLLQNAGSATPPEGNITLKVKMEQGEKNTLFVLFQITDEGGGIAADELSRVFSRRLKNDAPPIRGVGDSGVGLAIAKTLVEAHGGRIWVESDGEKTSTFSILLPVKTPAFSTKTLVS